MGTEAQLFIIMRKIASRKSVDYASLFFSYIRDYNSFIRNIALPYVNLLSLVFDYFNIPFNPKEIDYSGP